MTQIQPIEFDHLSSPSTPFDQIRKVRSDGSESWSARDLQEIVEYEQWRNFEAAVLKARDSISQDQGETAAQHHIADASKMVATGSGAQRGVSDYRLTRHGAYRVLQECDGRKPRIAEAKAYFAQRTQEAELMADLDDDLKLIHHMLLATQQNRREVRQVQLVQQRQGARQDELEARVDSIEGRSGWYTAMAYCKVNHLPCHLAYRTKLGVAGSKIAKQAHITLPKVPDERFGEVNKYPKWVLDKALEQMETANAGA